MNEKETKQVYDLYAELERVVAQSPFCRSEKVGDATRVDLVDVELAYLSTMMLAQKLATACQLAGQMSGEQFTATTRLAQYVGYVEAHIYILGISAEEAEAAYAARNPSVIDPTAYALVRDASRERDGEVRLTRDAAARTRRRRK